MTAERSDEEIFTLTDEQRAQARADFEAAIALYTDAELIADSRANFERTMAMTWQERRDRMTDPDGTDVTVE